MRHYIAQEFSVPRSAIVQRLVHFANTNPMYKIIYICYK